MIQNSVPKKGEIWRHYKHDPKSVENNFTYEIIGLVVHTETEEVLVCYRPLYDSEFLKEKNVDYYVRPLSMWNDNVDKNGYSGPRFVKIED